MTVFRLLRPTGRVLRATRGFLILLSTLAVFGTIAFIHRIETTSKFTISGLLVGHGLKEGDKCRNCSKELVHLSEEVAKALQALPPNSLTEDSNINRLEEMREPLETGQSPGNSALEAAEVLSPEEALPEEMIPDQESPVMKADMQPGQQSPVSTEVEQQGPQQQEHAQQQEAYAVRDQERDSEHASLRDQVLTSNQAANSKPENKSRTLLNIETDKKKSSKTNGPTQSSTKATAKIQGSDIEILKGPAIVAQTSSVTQPQLLKVVVKAQEENPPVVTRTLYHPGHTLPPKDVCPKQGEGLQLLILVTTAPGHVSQRSAVRSTWGHIAFRRDVAMAFVVGTSNNSEENELVKNENIIYGDIIQGNFIDTYNNLTLKTISMLEWSFQYCGKARFLLKTDDDMYIHAPVLLSILKNAASRQSAILGKVAKKWKPIRNTTSKYYITPSQFKLARYPDFNTGPAYVLTNDIVKPLYDAALNGTFFKLEDVYLTGIIAGALKVTHINYPEFFNRRLKLETCAVSKLASVHMVETHEMFDLWKRLSDGLTKCTH